MIKLFLIESWGFVSINDIKVKNKWIYYLVINDSNYYIMIYFFYISIYRKLYLNIWFYCIICYRNFFI